MPVVPPRRSLVAVAPLRAPVAREANDEFADRVKCGRCRLSFVRHPSIVPGSSSKWWLCPPCRSRLLGESSKTNSQWA